jgi:hypothetical protein
MYPCLVFYFKPKLKQCTFSYLVFYFKKKPLGKLYLLSSSDEMKVLPTLLGLLHWTRGKLPSVCLCLCVCVCVCVRVKERETERKREKERV